MSEPLLHLGQSAASLTGTRTYLQELEVVHTMVHWDHHQLGKNILDCFLEAFCN